MGNFLNKENNNNMNIETIKLLEKANIVLQNKIKILLKDLEDKKKKIDSLLSENHATNFESIVYKSMYDGLKFRYEELVHDYNDISKIDEFLKQNEKDFLDNNFEKKYLLDFQKFLNKKCVQLG